MGLDCAKSLLPMRRHKARQMRFIDIIIGQVLTARTRLGVELPLTLMNSFRTSNDTMKVLRANKKFHQEDIPLEIVASGTKDQRGNGPSCQLPGESRT